MGVGGARVGRTPTGTPECPGDPRYVSSAPVSPQGSGAEELLGLTVNPDIACGLGTSPEPPRPDGPPPVLLEVVCDLSAPLYPSLFPGIELSPSPDPEPLPTVSPRTPSSSPDPPSSSPDPPNSPPDPPVRPCPAAPAHGGGEAAAGTGGGDPAGGAAPHPGVCGDTGGRRGRGGTGVTPPCPRPRSGS